MSALTVTLATATPGGGVLGLSELAVEVRDKDGNVVLSGNFPDMTID